MRVALQRQSLNVSRVSALPRTLVSGRDRHVTPRTGQKGGGRAKRSKKGSGPFRLLSRSSSCLFSAIAYRPTSLRHFEPRAQTLALSNCKYLIGQDRRLPEPRLIYARLLIELRNAVAPCPFAITIFRSRVSTDTFRAVCFRIARSI